MRNSLSVIFIGNLVLFSISPYVSIFPNTIVITKCGTLLQQFIYSFACNFIGILTKKKKIASNSLRLDLELEFVIFFSHILVFKQLST